MITVFLYYLNIILSSSCIECVCARDGVAKRWHIIWSDPVHGSEGQVNILAYSVVFITRRRLPKIHIERASQDLRVESCFCKKNMAVGIWPSFAKRSEFIKFRRIHR